MKAISISPNSKRIETFARSVNILNNFQNLGFKTRSSFVEIVQEYSPDFKDFKKTRKLIEFWNLRHVNTQTVLELESIVERLNQE